MSESDFLKRSFKPFMGITYTNDRIRNVDGGNGVVIDCLLIAIDFDEKILKLQPIPNSLFTTGKWDEDFWASYEHCSITKCGLTIVRKELTIKKNE